MSLRRALPFQRHLPQLLETHASETNGDDKDPSVGEIAHCPFPWCRVFRSAHVVTRCSLHSKPKAKTLNLGTGKCRDLARVGFT